MKHRHPTHRESSYVLRRCTAVARIGLGAAINVTGLFVLVAGLLPAA